MMPIHVQIYYIMYMFVVCGFVASRLVPTVYAVQCTLWTNKVLGHVDETK